MRTSLRQMLEILNVNGHPCKWNISSGNCPIIEKYENFKFRPTKEDQDLAREMVRLDYDIYLLNRE